MYSFRGNSECHWLTILSKVTFKVSQYFINENYSVSHLVGTNEKLKLAKTLMIQIN